MLEVRNVTRQYGTGEATVMALNGVSLSAEKGDFIAIMGPSGCGKSTLLNVIGGLERLTSGEVILEGKRIDTLDENSFVQTRRGKIAYVFQQFHLLPSLTALENVMLPLVLAGKTGDHRDDALAILGKVGLEKRAKHRPSQLSGGEQQRVAIARALVNNPSLLLADEPTGNMDQKTSLEILDMISRLNREGQTIIMVTHDPGIAGLAGRVVNLKDGQVVDGMN
ncbi:MAG: ABC transporter ATP-binding protein [Dehalococcoidia bacterium]|nr:ABC transporter ATP-binding protein [Dehalococcoidia bacterium]